MSRRIVIYVGTRKLLALEANLAAEPKVLRQVTTLKPQGFERGLVTNLERAAWSLQNLIDALLPDRSSSEVNAHVVLGNARLKSYHFSSSQYYTEMPRPITPHEVRSVVEQTRSVATLPLSEFVLQSIPESFLVNDMPGVRDPLGLEAHRLGVELQIFTMAFEDFKNLSKAFEATDIQVDGYFPKTLTASENVLTEEEKNEGVLLVDIADDATHFVLWKNGYLADTKVIEFGSRYLTQQMAAEWGITLRDAERVKEQYATLERDSRFGEELIPLVERNGKKNHQIRRCEFQDVLVRQGKEWAQRITAEARAFCEHECLPYPHYVFTGGGVALEGFLEFLHREFGVEARMGLPRHIQAPQELLVDPSLTPAMGMVAWLGTQYEHHKKLFAPQGLWEKTYATARDWFTTYF